MDELYFLHPRKAKMPVDLIELYYLSLNEEKRLIALKTIFLSYESDPQMIELVENMIKYFQWCRDSRNQLVHAEHYPAMFGGDSDLLYLTKRLGKKTLEQGYVSLQLAELREIADNIHKGVQQCASLRIYLRMRDTPPADLPLHLKMFQLEPLPEKLPVPPPLELSQRPQIDGWPGHLRQPSGQ